MQMIEQCHHFPVELEPERNMRSVRVDRAVDEEAQRRDGASLRLTDI
jgi:hypothetical protein